MRPVNGVRPNSVVNRTSVSSSKPRCRRSRSRPTVGPSTRNERGSDDLLTARLRSYELAAKMQLAVPQVTDLTRETRATHHLYGLDRPETADFGRRCCTPASAATRR